ncbi:hypothetical protein HNQ47_000500 [Catenisphaera adipataccumulans]|uniref:Uncharacterized protein n=1 Tax=Catenisphaera adipataccumulans TaxID=700500 RepID=A0A7W8CVP7_9FIRM|nr:hypothetical protein [Catenisphaera adipataccumulans]
MKKISTICTEMATTILILFGAVNYADLRSDLVRVRENSTF